MFQSIRSRWLLATGIIVLLVIGLGILTIRYRVWPVRAAGDHDEPDLPAREEAPADLQKVREPYAAGVEALQRNDGPDAVRHFSSFTFGSRPVEEYRLYYLANGHQLAGNVSAARATLARLWRRTPRLIYANDVGFNLGNLYSETSDSRHAAEVFATLARVAEEPAVQASARWNVVNTRLAAGDLSGAFFSARNIVIRTPSAPEAKLAAAFVRSLSGLAADAPVPLTATERLERATALSETGGAKLAVEELDALERTAPHLRTAIRLQKGIALNRLRQYADSNEVLEPLASGPYKTAIPAIRYAARNYSAIGAAIDPKVVRTVKERKRVGSVNVRVGKGKKRRTVTRPKYQTVFRKVTLVDLEKKKKKDEADRLASERLKDLLQLPVDDDVRLETLNALIARAEAKNQDGYVQELVPQVVKIEPQADPALQHFWDKAWAAWMRGDLGTAGPLFRFISDTYTHPNVRRQSRYWYARTIERQGKKNEAMAIYRELADAPYADLYALHAVTRGAKRTDASENPLKKDGPDWSEIAEKEMPDELRIAHELIALSSMRDGYNEVRRKIDRKNARFGEALLADVYRTAGNEVLMYRSLRRAWPQLATVEQDSVPTYFMRMYYPLRYGEEIDEYATDMGLDANLVRALILQESYYNPEAKSRVGATGLMQLMPATAQDHARKLGIAFVTSRLENPSVNIRLGTFHLRMLLRMFNGNAHLAVASYNAGQGNVMKWRRAAPRRPMDEFLEAIPFQETRNYVKRVTILRSTYRRLTI